MKNIVLTVLMAAMSTGAMAEWVEIGVNGKTTQYVDSSSIRAKGNTMTAWTLIDAKTPDRIDQDEPHLSTKVQEEYNCPEEQFRVLAVSTHSKNMGQGRVIKFNINPTPWVAVPPDSFAALKFKLLCVNE